MVGQFYILTLFFRVSLDDIRFITTEVGDQETADRKAAESRQLILYAMALEAVC